MPSPRKTISPGFWRWHQRHVRRATYWRLGFGGFASTAAVLFVLHNIDVCGALAAIAGALFLLSLPGYIHTLIGKLRAVPYFEQPVSGPSTYLMGEALLRNSVALDAYLSAHGVTPISAFNSGDDFRGEALTWHDPQGALPVVERLLSAVHRNELTLDDAGAVETDLHLLAEKLRAAAQVQIRFCLLLQDYGGTNHQEHVMRKGTFFEVRAKGYQGPQGLP